MASENGNGLKLELKEIATVLEWFKQEHLQKELPKLSGGKIDEAFISRVKNGRIKAKNGKQLEALHQILNNPDLVIIHFDRQVARLTHTPEEKKRKIKIKHLICIMPTTNDDKDWNALVEFAEELSTEQKLFILPPTNFSIPDEQIKNEHEKLRFSSQSNQSEKSLFFKKLLDLNELVEFRRPKKWQLFIDCTEYFLIMVNGGSSKDSSQLKIKIGQEVEKFSVKLWMTHHGLDRTRSHPVPYKKMKFKQDKNKGKNDDGTPQDQLPKLNDNKKTHDTQKLIGTQMFKMVVEKLQATNSCSTKEELFKKFDDFKLLILLPNIVSLENQTQDRLIQLKDEFKDVAYSDQFDSIVRINVRNNEMVEKWNAFIKSAKSNKKTFHLIIHDECHWGAGKGQGAYKLLGFGETVDYHLADGKLLPNLFTVMVSATPFNFFTSDDLKSCDILNWKKFIENHYPPVEENKYQGLTELGSEETNKIVSAGNSGFDRKLLPLTVNGFSEEFVQVINDYVVGLRSFQTSLPADTNSVHEAVKKAIEEKKLIVIRLSSAKDYVRPYEVAKAVLKKAVKKLQIKMEVIVHNSEVKNGLDLKFDEHKAIALQNIQKRNPEQGDEEIKDPQFCDYAGIPMIMIVIECGRMGDTFPECVRFDLRARYLSPVQDFTSIIQDVGRAFGYNERPTLVLSQTANAFLVNIWDKEKDEISWERLRNVRSVVLGQHMKKIKSRQSVDEDELNQTNLNELQLFKEIFKKNEKDPVMLYGLGKNSFKHRIILKAEPQIGKTGAFLFLVYLFSKKINTTERKFFISRLDISTNKVYTLQTVAQTAEFFKTKEGKEWHTTYLSDLPYARANRKMEEILEPAEWAAASTVAELLKKKNQHFKKIRIADFGCGEQQFAKFLDKAIKDHPTLRKKKFRLESFDISPNPIPEVETNPNVTVIPLPGVNCSIEENFKAERYDYIIMTCMLWGKGDSWKPTLKTALHALKETGTIFLAEKKTRFPLENLQSLPNAGVNATPTRLSLRPDLNIEKFNSEFNAVAITKDDYGPDSLLQFLKR